LDAANKYFLIDNTNYNCRKDVMGLEKLNIPLFYFDKFGHPQRNPSQSKVALNYEAQRLSIRLTDGEPFIC
jgi:hypothetical protein